MKNQTWKKLKIKQMDLYITHPSAIWENSEMLQLKYLKRKTPSRMPDHSIH